MHTILPQAPIPKCQNVSRQGRARGLAATGSKEGVRILGLELGRAYG